MFGWEKYISNFGWEVDLINEKSGNVLLINKSSEEYRTLRPVMGGFYHGQFGLGVSDHNNISPIELGKLLDFTPSDETMELVNFHEKMKGIGFEHLRWEYYNSPTLVDYETLEHLPITEIKNKKDCLNYWKSGTENLDSINYDVKNLFEKIKTDDTFVRFVESVNALTYEIKRPNFSLTFKRDVRTRIWECDFDGEVNENIYDIEHYINKNFDKFNSNIPLPKSDTIPLTDFVL